MKLRKMAALARAVGQNKIEVVETICNDALAIDECDFFALATLADTYWRNERQADALPVAMKVLETHPNDFYALRIVAAVRAERGEHDEAYLYAKRLITAEPPSFPAKTISRFLAPLAWLPKVRRLKARASRDETEAMSSHSEWMEWANGYISWYESRERSAL